MTFGAEKVTFGVVPLPSLACPSIHPSIYLTLPRLSHAPIFFSLCFCNLQFCCPSVLFALHRVSQAHSVLCSNITLSWATQRTSSLTRTSALTLTLTLTHAHRKRSHCRPPASSTCLAQSRFSGIPSRRLCCSHGHSDSAATYVELCGDTAFLGLFLAQYLSALFTASCSSLCA